MKKILVMLFAVALVSGVSAQGHFYRGGGYYRSGVSVGVGLGYYAPLYPYYGYPYYAYPPYGYEARPSKLSLKIEDIKSDYNDKIYSVKQDPSLSGKERRQKVRELKHERDQAIDDLKRNYYKQ